MITETEKLTLERTAHFVKIGNEFQSYKISSSVLLSQTPDHELSVFETINNGVSCRITVNCGLTIPKIICKFAERTEDFDINHDYQTEVINTLIDFEFSGE